MRIKRSICILASFILLTLSGCESIDYGEVAKKSEKLDEYLRISQDKAREMMDEYSTYAIEDVVRDYAGKAKQEVKDQIKEGMAEYDGSSQPGILSGVEDVALTDLTGAGTDYAFIYDGVPYAAKYTPDNWEITDSYRITNAMDIALICQALINEHPIHGKDMISFRTCDDMAYEWVQHNIAYGFLKSWSGNQAGEPTEPAAETGADYDSWLNSVKNVDLDPKDQGRSYRELYEDRTGKRFDIRSFLE